MTTRAVTIFNKLLALLAPHLRDATFPGPAEASRLKQLELCLGRALPPELKAIYRVCNGSPKTPDEPLAENIFYSYRFLAVDQVLALASGLENTRLSDATSFPREPIPSYPPNAVRDLSTSVDWVAFADDRAGGYLAVDFDPGPTGAIGQIINFGRDDAAHFQLATSFESFLERVVWDYEMKRRHHFFGESMLLVDRLIEESKNAN